MLKEINISIGCYMTYFYLILSQLTISFSIVVSKYLLVNISPYLILEFRFLMASILLFVMACKLEPNFDVRSLLTWSFKDKTAFIMQGLSAGFLFNILLLTGLKESSAGTAGIISSFLPFMIILFSLIFFKEKLTKQKFISLIIATLGLILVNYKNSTTQEHLFIGDLLIFLSLIPETAYYIMSNKYNYAISPLWNAMFMNLINAIAFFPFIFFVGFNLENLESLNIIVLNLLLGITTAAFYLLWNIVSTKINSATAGLFTTVMPIGTLILAAIFLGEPIKTYQVLGLTLIIIAIVMGIKKQEKIIRKYKPNLH